MKNVLTILIFSLMGCAASNVLNEEAPADQGGGVGQPIPPDPIEFSIDECLVTRYAGDHGGDPVSDEIGDFDPEQEALLFANYPLFSPDYQLDLFGQEILVARNELFFERYESGRSPGIRDVVFGRSSDALVWQVLPDPESVCPPLPDGKEWPGSIEPTPVVDECLVTDFAADFGGESSTGEVGEFDPDQLTLLFANYPLVSPDYTFDSFGQEILVTRNDLFFERFEPGDFGGIREVVFGRASTDRAWHILVDPASVCAPLPEGQEWPTRL